MIGRILTITLFACALAAHGHPADAAAFRPNATVDGQDVTLGDLFDDCGPTAGTVVARAPEPGRRMIFDAHALTSLAQAYGLDWRSANPHDRTIVERSAILVGGDRIQALVESALSDKSVPHPFAVIFDQHALRVALPTDTGALSVQSMSYDDEQKRFSGALTAPAPDGPIIIEVSGRVASVVEIPVLNRVLNEGEIVGIADLDLVQMERDRVTQDTLLKPEDIVGHTAERPIPARHPLRARDLKRDLVVKRGQTVTLTLDDPSFSLTTQGRALTDGAKGDPVRVINTASSRIVEGFAAGLALVSVSDTIPTLPGANSPATP